jgi:rod shape-determining protein MreC
MKPRSQYWNPAWRQRYILAALLIGHLVLVFLGKHAYTIWRGSADFFVRPAMLISEKYEGWRYNRLHKVNDFSVAQAELDALREELANLRNQVQKDSARLVEADEAVKLLGLKERLPFEVQSARVIANNRADAPWGGIIIDIGEDHGLKDDQGVICAEGVVGRIWSVGSRQSIVLPLDAHNTSTPVMLAKSRSTGVLQGIGPGIAIIRYISSQEAVQVGEPVYTSGLAQIFPPGMLVGYVSQVSPGDFEMNIAVTLATPLDRLRILHILPIGPQLEFNTKLEPPPSISSRGRN